MLEQAIRGPTVPFFLGGGYPPTRKNEEIDLLDEILDSGRLTAVFQPIVDFRSLSYIAFEGLIRGPKDTVLHSPQQLFEVAERHGQRRNLERACDQRIASVMDENQLASLNDENGFFAENRRGQMVFYALPTLSIGAVPVGTDVFESHREISAAAAEAKKNAKRSAGSSLFIERRMIKT